MLQKIIDAPFAFIFFMLAVLLLNIGAAVRMRHENNLKNSSHQERRTKLRLLPDHRWSSKRRKRQGK